MMLSILLRLSLLCMIGYGGYRVFKEQTTASFCRAEAKKLEARFEHLLDLQSDRIHLRSMQREDAFGSWLFYAPAGKAFELQLHSKGDKSTMMRVPSRSRGHYGLIQIHFEYEEDATAPALRKLEVFGPDFTTYHRRADKDAMYINIDLKLEGIEKKVNPIDAMPPADSWFQGMRIPSVMHFRNVDCDSSQNALLAYFSEEELPGTKLKHRDFAIVAVEVGDR